MRSAALVVFIAFLAAPLGQAKQHSTFQVRAQPNADTGPVFSTEPTDWPAQRK